MVSSKTRNSERTEPKTLGRRKVRRSERNYGRGRRARKGN